jgi:sugar/nucleoside kinase (ribokinase family)
MRHDTAGYASLQILRTVIPPVVGYAPFFIAATIMTHSVQLLGISNAIVDVLSHIDDDFLERIGAVPGSMTLVDLDRAREIYSMMGPATEMSGGSVANTVAGFAILGGSAAYIGHVKADQLGGIFNHDMRSLGVDIRLQPGRDGAPTARSHVLISGDGQRTMQTYLGSCTELGTRHITAETMGTPKVVLIEGYVFDLPEGPELARKAMDIAAQNGSTVALSLSDSFCVERHRESFAAAVEDGVRIVVADEDEVNALLRTETFDETLEALRGYDNLFVMTRSDKGSVVVRGEETVVQAAIEVADVIDTTGAGDAYCAGFLYGWANDRPLAECARLGTRCGTAVIQQVGARIEPGVLDDSA